MKGPWAAWAARYDGLQTRERVLLLAAVMTAAVFGLYQFAIGPQAAKREAAEKRLGQSRQELAQIDAQIGLITTEARDPDAPLRARLETLRGEIGEADVRLKALEKALVPPQQIPALLQEMLHRRGGLRLVGLKSLTPAPFTEGAPGDKPGKGKDDGATAEVAIYRHGVEVVVEGGYGDLMAYLDELEKTPRRLYWGSVSLRVEAHPRSRMTVTVHTLSLERAWLRV